MTRLSITLTDSQAAALQRISAETGATKQSMIGLAISAWIRQYETLPMRTPKTSENRPHGLEDMEPTPTFCEVCGRIADWASFADDGTEHYFCEHHGMSDLAQR